MINTHDSALASKLGEELVDSKAPFFTPASPEPLYGGEGYLSIVHLMRKSFSDVGWTLEKMVVDEDVAAVKWTFHGTNDGPFFGKEPTNKKVNVCVMNFYYFNKEGKIIKDEAAAGMFGILEQCGFFRNERYVK